MNIRKSTLAGYWYPSDKKSLKRKIKSFLDEDMVKSDRELKALIVPHAGYKYSGAVAGVGYSYLKKCYKKVFIFGTSHNKSYSGMSIPSFSHYRTPLGDVPLNEESKVMQNNHELIKSLNEAHISEHSIEIQLPFLTYIFNKFDCDFSIIPLLFGLVNPEISSKIINNYILNDSLIIVSADLSHFLSNSDATKKDKSTINSILNLKEVIKENSTCNPYGVNTVINIAKKNGWEPKLLEYKNSSDFTNDYSRVVGYASIGFFN
ncbi:MAG: AmmeMemoRadiSam system protein B [Candidatus Woesearchaeota archaeon]